MAIYGISSPYTRRYKVIRTPNAVGVPVSPGTYPPVYIPFSDLVNGIVDGNYIRVVMPASNGLPQRPFWFRPPDLVLSPIIFNPPTPGPIIHWQDTGQISASILTPEEASDNLTRAVSLAGFAYGLYYAFKHGGGFWNYVKFAFLFNFIGWAAGSAVGYSIKAIKKQ